MQWSAQWIADATNGTLIGEPHTRVSSVVTDSREAVAGSMYVARIGENSDGHDYVPAAVANGARIVLVQRELPDVDVCQIVVEETTVALGAMARAHIAQLRLNGDLHVIAVTGSAGKTTTKDLMAQIFGSAAQTVAPRLSYNNEVGVPLTALLAEETTRYLVLEMGASGPGHLTYLTDIIAPDMAIELMVGHAHMGGFGSVEGVAHAKAELVRGLRPGGTALLNADDPHVAAMGEDVSGQVFFFSVLQGDNAQTAHQRAHFIAEDVRIDALERVSFTFTQTTTGESHPVALRLVGSHHVHNALAAGSAAVLMGVPMVDVVRVLSEATPQSPHRMALHDFTLNGHAVTLIDDSYNANSDSMRAALHAVESLSQGRRTIAILGEMLELGDTSREAHEEVGRWAVDAGVDVLIALGQDGRFYLTGAAQASEAHNMGIYHAQSVQEALTTTFKLLDGPSIVLVKGSNGSGAWRVADALIERGQAK